MKWQKISSLSHVSNITFEKVTFCHKCLGNGYILEKGVKMGHKVDLVQEIVWTYHKLYTVAKN